MWLYCTPLLVTTLIRAPIPSRLLFVPCNAMSSQWPEFWLRFIQISAPLPIALTTTSTRPSPSRSPNAQPRWRAAGEESNPAFSVKASHFHFVRDCGTLRCIDQSAVLAAEPIARDHRL